MSPSFNDSLDPALLTGIRTIDEQHLSWCRHYQALADAMAGNGSTEEVARTFAFLVEYTAEHFATEEKYMVDHGYPGTLVHKQEHDKLVRGLSKLLDEFRAKGTVETVARGLAAFMEEWFKGHIQNVDKPLGNFLKKKGY